MNLSPSDEPRIDVPWGPSDAAAGAVALLALTLVALGLAWITPGDTLPLWTVLSATLLLQIAMFGIAFRLGPFNRGPVELLFGPARLGTLANLGWGFIALMGSILISAIYIVVAGAISDDLVPTPLPEGVDFHELRWFSFLVIVIVGPLAEEIFYRGFLFAALLRRFGPLGATAISAGVFAVSHGDPLLLAPTFIAGAVFALVYYRTRTIWPLVIAHTAQNALAFAISG